MPAALAYAGGALPLLSAMIGTSWPFELASHFVVLAALGVTGIASLCAWRRRWLEAYVGGALALAYVALCVPLYVPPTAAPPGDRASLKVLTANLLYRSHDAAAALAWIGKMQPDVLVLLELTPRWRAALQPVLRGYGGRFEILRDDAFGIGVYSRRAPLSARDASRDELPMLEARLVHEGRAATLFAVHTVPPINTYAAAMRDRQLEHVGQLARRAGRNAIVAGDLNTTSWSPSFRRVLEASSLVDTRRGFGIQGTWHSSWPAPILIPIDHVLTSPDVVTLAREVAPETGSDHRAVFVELSLD
jgi:endonuclease/exonuclease/phosphatase (EEP) superfamily protein YafD